MNRPSGLGRGLSSLIPQKNVNTDLVAHENRLVLLTDDNQILQIPVEQIVANPHQPRQIFDHEDLENLVNSIRDYGIIQPLIVTRQGSGYELIAGERRFRSAKILGLATVPCLVRAADEQQKLELALIENIQRKNLNPIEEGLAYHRLIEEFNLTQEQAADKLGKSRSVVANTIRLLTLPEEVQKALVDGKITEGHARVIAGLETPEEQLDFLNKILSLNFTVRDAELESRRLLPRRKTTVARKSVDPELEAAKEDLRSALATKVDIKKQGEEGQIVISFYSDDELRGLIKKITS